MRRLAVAMLLSLCAVLPCAAKWANLWEPVPLDRLLRNVERLVRRQPKDPRGHYTLGRLHSLAFARGVAGVDVRVGPIGAPPPSLPEFPPYESIREDLPSSREQLKPGAYHHLLESIRQYQRAAELDPGTSLYWLGLGWMLEQGAPFARGARPGHGPRRCRSLPLAPKRASPSFGPPRGGSVPSAVWREQALTAYRRAYALDIQNDLGQPSLGPGADSSIALEAGEGIVRILKLKGGALTAAELQELGSVEQSVKALMSKPRSITPIIFPLDGAASLRQLLAPEKIVSFDLAGDGRKERWPWVGPETGILVWDPSHRGEIVSGRQLFGSVTWSMFWRDGYEPLAALDDDRDGWLRGQELDELAVWVDRNANGISEAGEVRPLASIDVVAVAVLRQAWSEGAPCNPDGLRRRDGSSICTYDWTPTSLPRPHTRAARRARTGGGADLGPCFTVRIDMECNPFVRGPFPVGVRSGQAIDEKRDNRQLCATRPFTPEAIR